MDFFAYWQAYQVAELLAAATVRFYVTPGFEKRLAMGAEVTFRWVEARARGIRKRWDERRPTFEWLSELRTIHAAGMPLERSDAERAAADVAGAVKDSASQQGLTPEKVTADIRDTLLVIWNDWDRMGNALPGGDKLRGFLREDIEYALYLLKMLSNRPIDFLAADWTYPDRQRRDWAQLIDALPKDGWLARREFSGYAIEYVNPSMWPARGPFSLDQKAIDDLLAKFWNDSRALRRFCLAFFRLHQELNRRGSASGAKVLHSNEVIEQMIATILDAEKLVVSIYMKRNPSGTDRHPGIWQLVEDRLGALLAKIDLSEEIAAKAKERLQALRPRTLLHDPAVRRRDLFVIPAEVGSGSDKADYFAAAHVNFIIARNYAAHHDSLDDDFVMPSDLDPSQHPGRVAMQSTLTVLLACLQTAADSE